MLSTQVWTPPKAYDRAAAEVSKAVRDYDERLGFGVNPDNGQWCIFMRQGTTEETRGGDLPVLGFPNIPSPEEAKRRLYESDAVRRGSEIVAEINKHNEEITRKFEDAASDASGEAAEAMEWFNRVAGTHPIPRIFVNKEVKHG